MITQIICVALCLTAVGVCVYEEFRVRTMRQAHSKALDVWHQELGKWRQEKIVLYTMLAEMRQKDMSYFRLVSRTLCQLIHASRVPFHKDDSAPEDA